MKLFFGSLIGLVLSIHVGAEPLLEGRVRLSSGQPAAGVQVRLFDLTDLRRFIGTTTDETGHFALPLRAFSTAQGHDSADRLCAGAELSQPVQPLYHHSLSTAGVWPRAARSVQCAGAAAGHVSRCGTVGGDAHGAMGWDGCGRGGLWERGCISTG